MTSAVEQAGNEHPVGFPPHRDASLLQSHFPRPLWYLGRPQDGSPVGFYSQSDSMGLGTPPLSKGSPKVEVCGNGATKSKESSVLPHWMESKRGCATQPAVQLDNAPEAGPSTPMKCPPKQLTETPNSVLHFSSAASMAMFEQRKVMWTRQDQTPIGPAGANLSMYLSSSRSVDAGLQREVGQKESQKENVMSLKELKSPAKTASLKGGSSPPQVGQPAATRALATLASTRKPCLPGDDLQLHLRHEPSSRSPVISPEKRHGSDRRIQHDPGVSDTPMPIVKQEILNRSATRGTPLTVGIRAHVLSRGPKTDAHEFPPGSRHESVRSMINSSRMFDHQLPRQPNSVTEGSTFDADLSLALQPACEHDSSLAWHSGDSPSRPSAHKWSEMNTPTFSTSLCRDGAQSVSSTAAPLAPRTPADNMLVFQFLSSAREPAGKQSRLDDERMGVLNEGVVGGGRKRKQFRKFYNTADYPASASEVIEVNRTAEPADLRTQIKKRAKRENLEVQPLVPSVMRDALEDVGREDTSLQICLQTSATISHPKKHDFFPDKPRSADATVSSPLKRSPLESQGHCGTGSSSICNSNAGILGSDDFANDNSVKILDTEIPGVPSQAAIPGCSLRASPIDTQLLLKETELFIGRESLAAGVQILPRVVSHFGNHAEESPLADASWQRGTAPYTVPAHAPMPKTHPTFSAGEPSLPLSLSCFAEPQRTQVGIKNSIGSTPKPEEEWGKSLALSATPVAAVTPPQSAGKTTMGYQERFVHLQAYLKRCDEGDQKNQSQVLRALSPAARSGHAVDLERKAMWLAVEEGREMRRVNTINVMGWNMGSASEADLVDDGTIPRGWPLAVPDMMPSGETPLLGSAPYPRVVVPSLVFSSTSTAAFS